MVQASLNDFENVLKQCGVNDDSLSPAETQALDRDGFVVMTNLIEAGWLARLRDAFEEASGKAANTPVNKESGTRHIDDLISRGEAFDRVYTNPRVLAAVYHILKVPFRLAQLTGREPLQGYGAQGLHGDWTARAKGEPFRIVTTIWLLDDFTPNNGATRVVPGTHRLLTQPPKSLAEPANRHPEQRIIVAEAGSVVVFNGHLWHSGTRNETQRSRRVLQCSFVGRGELRFGRIKVNEPERLSRSARKLLGEE